MVEGSGLLRQPDRIVLGNQAHSGSEPDRRGGCRGRAKSHPLVDGPGICNGYIVAVRPPSARERKVAVLGKPDGLETRCFTSSSGYMGRSRLIGRERQDAIVRARHEMDRSRDHSPDRPTTTTTVQRMDTESHGERTGAVTAAIVGAGIGGLAAALTLRRVGIEVEVYEAATILGEIGAGIQISPNASRVLIGLGLGDELDRVGVRPLTGDMRRWDDGALITSQPLGEAVERQFGAPYFHLHRADLHRILADAVGPRQIHLGRECGEVISRRDRPQIEFVDGSRLAFDIVIGADGIHSKVRASMFGREDPRFSGNTVWRGMVPAQHIEDLSLPVNSTLVMGPGQHFVYYFVSGGEYVNWVGVAPSTTWTAESWTDEGRLDDALADFEGWNSTVRRLIGEMKGKPIYRWALYDRDPLPSWGKGPVTLLGDACHPMLPFMAQGAAQAIEDAAVLAGCLAQTHEAATALRRYEELRRRRTARVQMAARDNEAMFHLPDGEEQSTRDARLASQSGSGAAHRNSWLFDYDADTAARPDNP